MRLAALLLAAVPLAAGAAEWVEISPDNGIFAAYADRSTIRRQGGAALMRGLYDFRRGDFTPEGHRFHSTTVEREYDCSGRRVRLLSYEDHAQRLGEGTVVGASSTPRRWEKVVDGSVDAAILSVACAAN